MEGLNGTLAHPTDLRLDSLYNYIDDMINIDNLSLSLSLHIDRYRCIASQLDDRYTYTCIGINR